MNRSLLWLLAVGITLATLIIGCSDQSSQVNAPEQQQSSTQAPLLNKTVGANYIDGSYIVVFKDAVADVDNEMNDFGKKHAIKANYTYKHALKGFAGKLTATQLEALRNDTRVAYIEQDQIAHINAVQTNPPSWGLDRIDQRNLPLDASYTYNQTGLGVDAYCIDTGIRFTHVDFGGRAVTGYDAITIGGTAADGNGHGTHTAGTIGGASYGVAKDVRLIAVRVLDNSGSGSYSQVVAGVDWVTNDHTTRPAVANMSLGGPVDAALDQAVRNSIADGVTYCVSAGNGTTNASTQSPADVTEAITVGATSITDAFAYFSNYGSVVDISGPGVNITSAWFTTNTATNTISGTSMSSPHVAGAVALYLEANPTATPATVQSAIKSNGTSNVISGIPAGTVNLLLYSVVASGPPPSPPAAPALSSPVDGATGIAVPTTLTWNASTGAVSYTVQVSTSSSFTTFAYNVSGITSTSTSVSGLAANTVYYWRVNATNAGGTSAWSASWSFTTAAAPIATVPGAPTGLTATAFGGPSQHKIKLAWTAPSNGGSPIMNYKIYRGAVSGGETLLTTVGNVVNYTDASGTSNTTYFYKVSAVNAVGEGVQSNEATAKTK